MQLRMTLPPDLASFFVDRGRGKGEVRCDGGNVLRRAVVTLEFDPGPACAEEITFLRHHDGSRMSLGVGAG